MQNYGMNAAKPSVALLTLAASALAGCAAAQGTTAAAQGHTTSSAARLIGIHATGPQADLDRLQDFATKSGFPSQQMDGPEGWQLVIVFPPGSSPTSVQSFIGRLRRADFAALTFRSAIAPVP
jgi:hypothetical protein